MVLEVKGKIGGSHETHIMKFEFKADQTILYGLRRNLLKYSRKFR